MKKMANKILLVCALLGSFNAHALLIKMDFTTLNSFDIYGQGTNNFDVTNFGFDASLFSTFTQNILTAVKEDYFSSSYAFINANQELDIDFMLAAVGDDVSAIDANNYTVQIGTRTSPDEGYLGAACGGCVTAGTVAPNTVFGSIFSDKIASALFATAGSAWDMIEATNAIAGTLSHEIGHALGLGHPSGAESNPGASPFGIMATGAGPSYMPSSERLVNRAFSDNSMFTLVNNIGLRDIVVNDVTEPSMLMLFAVGLIMLARRKIGGQLKR